MIRALVVDDEAPARRRMLQLLSQFSDIDVVGEAENGLAALEKVTAIKPDLVFLDIEMPELDGLSVAEALGSEGPAIIFVTAYDEHALRAFELSAIDYVVKPLSAERLQAAVSKIRKRQITDSKNGLSQLISSLKTRQQDRRLALRCGSKFVVVETSDISAVVAKDHYAAILFEGKELLTDDPLDLLATRLCQESFVRIHRSALLNLSHLRELQREGDRKYVAVLSDAVSTKLPISRERLPELKARLGIQ